MAARCYAVFEQSSALLGGNRRRNNPGIEANAQSARAQLRPKGGTRPPDGLLDAGMDKRVRRQRSITTIASSRLSEAGYNQSGACSVG